MHPERRLTFGPFCLDLRAGFLRRGDVDVPLRPRPFAVLCYLAERPSQRMNWEYYFFVDIEGHIDEKNVVAALAEAKKHCLQLTVLGSFPRAREVL